jgi:4-hydroxybenzoate polyprenyltransferase
MISQERKVMKPYGLMSTGFYKSYFIHMRPYLLFVSGVAGYAGMSLSFKGADWEITRLTLCLLVFFLGYGFGQALTDCFQIDTDSISSSYRPLVRGVIHKKDVLIISIAGLTGIGIPLVMFNFLNALLLLLSASGLLTYTYFKKNKTWLGPFWNSWIVMLLPFSGYLSYSNNLSWQDIFSNSSLLILALMTFASYANFVLIGYLKDITADRQTAYKTFPVVYGWQKTIWMGNLNTLIAIICCGMIVYFNYTIWGLLFMLLGSVIAISGQLFGLMTKNKTETNSAFPVAATVRSLILFHLSVIFCFQENLSVLIAGCIFYIVFEIVIFSRPQKEQI